MRPWWRRTGGAACVLAWAAAGVPGTEACSSKTSSSSDLTGTWDLTATDPGSAPSTGTLTISSDSLYVAIGSDVLSYQATGGGTMIVTSWYDPDNGETTATTTTHASSPLDLGIFPLALGGSWSFTGIVDPTASCRATAGATAFSATCAGDIDWPDFLFPGPTASGTYVAQQMMALDSQFGALGGQWQLALMGSSAGGCTMTFQGSTISSTCSGTESNLDGTAQLAFNGTSLASGVSGGVELSAQKQ